MSFANPGLKPRFRKKMPDFNDTSYPCQSQWMVLLGCYEKSEWQKSKCAQFYNALSECEDGWKLARLQGSSANYHMRRMMRGLDFKLPKLR